MEYACGLNACLNRVALSGIELIEWH